MHVPALSDEADSLYVPLGGLRPWAEVATDDDAWDRAQGELARLRSGEPARADMVLRGARLAAAHQSGVMDGVYAGAPGVVAELLCGATMPAAVDADAQSHVRANYEALRLAAAAPVTSADAILRIHEVACGPQRTHPVRVEGRVQDHVFAHGEYKHHPNHVPGPGGGWLARAPVDQVGPEMARLFATIAGPEFSRLHPAVAAAYVLHAVSHVAPFADGNGRVARALAGWLLVRATGNPLLVRADEAGRYEDALAAPDRGDVAGLVHFVHGRCTQLVADLRAAAADERADTALPRWRGEAETAGMLGGMLRGATQRALERRRARTDLGWLSPLTDAELMAPVPDNHDERFDAPPLVVRVPLPGGAVEETFAVDAHPLDGAGCVVLRAADARLRMDVPLGVTVGELSGQLERWLDRVTSTLALRVAAELE